MSIFRKITGGKNRRRSSNRQPSPHPRPSVPLSSASFARIWVIGGGKGGTGKSFLATNFGLMLAAQSKKVLLIDADLGAANLHTLLGINGTNLSLSSFLKAEIKSLDPLIKNTGVAGLDIITGAMDSLNVADVSKQAIERLREGLMRTDYNNIIVDIGPGTSSNMLGLFLLAHNAVIVTTPEPTSVENTYRYLKCLLLQRVRNIIHSGNETVLRERLLKIIRDNPLGQIKNVSDLMLLLKREEAGYPGLLDSFMGQTSLSLVVSQSMNEEDRAIGRKMRLACRNFFGVDIGYAGDIPYIEGMRNRLYGQGPDKFEDLDPRTSEALGACVKQLLTIDKRNINTKERD